MGADEAEKDRELENQLLKDAEAVEEAHDPTGMGRDPAEGETVRQIADKRTRA
ncbi:MAG TPA: hypothetical protein VFH45_07765 [Acidimicrobiales bacterium]|nr:hypothetical protein [Acidimicrobiales bacterium]